MYRCRCKIPSYSYDTYEVQSDWHNILINQSIPWTKEDGVWSLSSCNRYIRHNGTMLHNLAQHVNMSTESCNQWVYDTSKFTSTFITQVSLRDIDILNVQLWTYAGIQYISEINLFVGLL